MAVRIGADFLATGRLTGLLLLASETLVIVFTVFRRAPSIVDRTLRARLLTAISMMGPPLVRPALGIKELPALDAVLVSHAHFDHLDRRTLRRVASDQPIVVPIGVGNLVHDLGFQIVHELDYWQSIKLGPVEVSLTPCYHWGARFLADLHAQFLGNAFGHRTGD